MIKRHVGKIVKVVKQLQIKIKKIKIMEKKMLRAMNRNPKNPLAMREIRRSFLSGWETISQDWTYLAFLGTGRTLDMK